MRIVPFFLILILLSGSDVIGQSKYFVKYKQSVPLSRVNSVVADMTQLQQRIPIPQKASISKIKKLRYIPDTEDSPLARIISVQFSGNVSPEDVLKLFTGDEIEYIEQNHIYHIDSIPNDSLYSQQWALQKIGAPAAWAVSEGADTVLIGVIDTGIDFNHPDISHQLFINPGETGKDNLGRDKRFNGVDDDNNGFIDDFQGWDFTDRTGFPFDSTNGDYVGWDNMPMDENGYSHGTAVAGIIAAEMNNVIGIAGVAPKVKILNLRAFDPDGNGEEDDVAAAILYAVKMNVKVINMSFGDNSFSYVLRDVVRFAYSKNIVLVASSGNDGVNTPHYPSGYSEVICVGNSTSDDYVASSSNYGSTLDLVAPGTGIITLARHNSYQDFNGTSAAAPFVSAAAGLLLSKQAFSNEEVKQILKTTADDIGDEGWDEKSGAGRLNVGKAMQVLAPSIIKFNYPLQDFASSQDTLNLSATILSSYFAEYSLEWGFGANPESWNSIAEHKLYQVNNQYIGTLPLSTVKMDTVLTLRIRMVMTNGRTMEERINIHTIRNRPLGEVVTLLPAYYGRSVTICAAVQTSTPAIVRMYYKTEGESDFKNISLEGFTVNNLFVKQIHYGFIPQGLLQENTLYQVFFEVENLLGIRNRFTKSGAAVDVVLTADIIHDRAVRELPYQLPAGGVFADPVQVITQQKNDVLFYTNGNTSTTKLYHFNGAGFDLKDSLSQRIIKDAGDFNKDGKTDLLALWGQNGYILEQANQGASKFDEKFKREDGKFWPILVKDIDNDGKNELLALVADSICVFRVENDLQLTYLTAVHNFSSSIYGANFFNSPHAVITDLNGDGINELWIPDYEGDILCYNILSASHIVPDTVRSFRTQLPTSSDYITAGDYDGDGHPELAILLHSLEARDIAKFYVLYIVKFVGDKLVLEAANAFIDPSSDFQVFRQGYNSLKFDTLYSTKKSDLVLNLFPFSYVFSYENSDSKIVFYRENTNCNAVLTADFNGNGKREFSVSSNAGTKFFEFIDGTLPETVAEIAGCSISSSSIQLQWHSTEKLFYILRGSSNDNLQVIDSTSALSYIDKNVKLNTNYFYSIQAYKQDGSKAVLTTPIVVYHHKPASFVSVQNTIGRKLEIMYSDRLQKTVYDLTSMYAKDNSGNVYLVQTIVPAGETGYLISFPDDLQAGPYSVYLRGVTDFYGAHAIDTVISVQFTDTHAAPSLYISSFRLINAHALELTFNLPIDSASGLNPMNYSFTPIRQIKNISFQDVLHTVVLINIESGKPLGAVGYESTLKLKGLQSTVASGAVKIVENGAGSYIALEYNAQDISNVYTYPSPAHISNGQGYITFANLPHYAEIMVFNITGKKIKTLNVSTSNGGYNWDLRDDNNTLLGTGVYFYRIRQLNDKNDELSTKLYKFSVVR
ncbi:MAG: S8 family serine peptidase [Ignavibacteria bacterium]|nr:S8 family serine peptidase [Ignavibacteria bacterium]